jgi:hypothetical protein
MIEFIFDIKKIKYAENNITYVYSIILLILKSQETDKKKEIPYQKLPFIFWAVKNDDNLEKIIQIKKKKIELLPIWDIDTSIDKAISLLYANNYINIHAKSKGVNLSITETGEEIYKVVENLNCFKNIKERLKRLGLIPANFINHEIGFLSC